VADTVTAPRATPTTGDDYFPSQKAEGAVELDQHAITWELEAYFNTAKSASKEQERTAQSMFGNGPIVQQA